MHTSARNGFPLRKTIILPLQYLPAERLSPHHSGSDAHGTTDHTQQQAAASTPSVMTSVCPLHRRPPCVSVTPGLRHRLRHRRPSGAVVWGGGAQRQQGSAGRSAKCTVMGEDER